MWSILAVGLFNSIMFPTIFTLAIEGLGPLKPQGSGILCTAIFGGAVIPPLLGLLADGFGFKVAFLLVISCYFYVTYYAWNERRQGQTPGALTLSAGPHVLRLEKDGYSAKDFDLVLAPREVRDLSVSLDKPPITSKWWFWTAIGGVVAAGAVTTFVLLTTERSPDGSPSLGSFRAP